MGKKQRSKTATGSTNLPKGFSLIEVMVSMAIFSLIMLSAVQLFVYSMRAKQLVLAHSQLINEMSYNLEHISRGLRMAKKSADGNCLSAAGINFEKTINGIKFLNPDINGELECVTYYLDNGRLMERRVFPGGNFFELPLTSPKINIQSFSVAYDQSYSGWPQDEDPHLQPRVTIYIRAQNLEKETIQNQITVSQRDIDVVEWSNN